MARGTASRLSGVLLLLCLVCAVPPRGQAQQTDPAAQFVDRLLSRYNGPAASPGCAVAVARDGKTLFESGYGYADLEHDVKNAPSTSFYLASLSKQFTAMSIVLLSQQGVLSLDDDVRRWVPEVSDSLGVTITLRHLLGHTSGLRDYFTLLALQGWNADESYTEGELLDLVRRQRRLNFQPGERFLYSNTGYALLGIVVKRASGMPLRLFAARHIFEPLGMTRTQFRDDHRMTVRNRAQAYDPVESEFRLTVPKLDIVGDGGVYSTVQDLLRWDTNFETGLVGGREGVALLQTPGRLNSGSVTGYAMGLSMGRLGASPAMSMSGAFGGYSTSYVRVAELKLSVVALCNSSTAPPELASQIATLYLPVTVGTGTLPGIAIPTPYFRPQVAASEGDRTIEIPDLMELAWLEGKYYCDELNMQVTLRLGGNVIHMERPRGNRITFSRVSAGVYASPEQMTILIVKDPAGSVKSFTLSFGRASDLRFVRQLL
jgi:CubicO group peptidase (beta-lactamase class C family)